MTTDDRLQRMAAFLLEDEARRDRNGHLAVYPLPSGDGGGTLEVAGFNNRYHPDEFQVLAELVHDGEWEEAERYARKYMIRYTDAVEFWQEHMDPGVEYFLRDTAFNRGPTGAARILQKALDVHIDGEVGPATRKVLELSEPTELLGKLREAREWYERVFAHRGPGNKFWKGLANRWNKVYARAKEMQNDMAVTVAVR
jgi:hypothetical protein